MPLQIVCQKCGYILYEGSLRNPDDILGSNHKCPKCERKLADSPRLTEVESRRFTEEEIKSLIKETS